MWHGQVFLPVSCFLWYTLLKRKKTILKKIHSGKVEPTTEMKMKMKMKLNNFRDEVAEFLQRVDPHGCESDAFILGMLDEEFSLLKKSLSFPDQLRHQIYDVIFLLFELAAKHKLDLDMEWETGRTRKQKYKEPQCDGTIPGRR
jgi:hypothetical protein